MLIEVTFDFEMNLIQLYFKMMKINNKKSFNRDFYKEAHK